MTVEEQIRELLAEVYLPAGVDLWLRSRNRYLDMQVPAELIASGRSAEVLEAVKYITGGAW